MKRIFFLYVISTIPLTSSIALHPDSSNAITWKPNGGRFGDNLLSYSKAKWISHRYHIPLLYVNFPYANRLALSKQEQLYTAESNEQFSRIITLPASSHHAIPSQRNTLYISTWKSNIRVNWFDTIFVDELRKNIAPLQGLDLITPPEGYISIAAHVRDGGAYPGDNAKEKERCPLRFVPRDFFIQQIERIARMFPDDNLYVFIFTDHPNPEKLMAKFQKKLNNPRITCDCRRENNSHKTNVLEDFFSMMQFDCLIRPGSHYSRFVQRLGYNRVVIYPQGFKEVDGKKIINVINLKTRSDANKRWKTEKITIA